MSDKEQLIGYIDGKPVYSLISIIKQSTEELREYINEEFKVTFDEKDTE